MTDRPERFLATARELAVELARRAIPAATGVTWEGDEFGGSEGSVVRIVHRETGPDLYGGTAGIALFLAHAAPLIEDDRVERHAREGMRNALSRARDCLERGSVSLYAGAGGIAVAGLAIAEVLNDAPLERLATDLALEIAEGVSTVRTPSSLDLIGGLAGTIVALVAAYRVRPDAKLLEACLTAADMLASEARRSWWGSAWAEGTAPALCGLGHGASGIAWALSELGWLTGRAPLTALAADAFRWERGLFDPDRCAWPDLREPEADEPGREQPSWMTAWCHGAIGIGAVRLRAYEHTRDLAALAEASACLQAARGLVIASAGAVHERAESVDVTLCHGLAGAAELFLLAYEVLGREEHLRAARRTGDLCLASRRVNGDQWPPGLRGATDVPGLFLGLAGVGLSMLRLHDPRLAGSPLLAGRAARTSPA